MRTPRLPTVYVSVAITRCPYTSGGGEGPAVNKFEQVPSDDHQMSVTGGRGVPRSDVPGGTLPIPCNPQMTSNFRTFSSN